MTRPDLPWAQSPFSMRCQAVREPRPQEATAKLRGVYHGRCELARGHDPATAHAIVRGGVVLRWSTDWTEK